MKQLSSLCLILLISFSSLAQGSKVVDNYNLSKKRLLIQACSMYVYNANQGNIDADSATVLACKAYKLPLTLSYDEGYNNGNAVIGSDLIEIGNIDAVKILLAKSNGENKIRLLIQLGSYYLFQTGAKTADIQNAGLYINQAVALSKQLKIQKWQNLSMILLGKYYTQTSNPEKSKQSFQQVISNCRKQGDKEALAMALDNYGNYMHPLDPEKEKRLKEAADLYKQLGFEEKRIEMNMRITTIHFWQMNMKLATKELYQSLADLRKIGFAHQQFTETTISYAEMSQYNLRSALYYAIKSVDRMEKTKDFTFADIFYFRLGAVYNNLGHFEEALDMYEKSIAFGKNNINSGNWYKSFYSSVLSLAQIGKPREALKFIDDVIQKYPPASDLDEMNLNRCIAVCYWWLKDEPKTKFYLKKMAQSAEKVTAPEAFRDVVSCYSTIAAFYSNRYNVKESTYYTDKIIALGKAQHKRPNEQNFFIALYKTDSVKGNYTSSLKNYQRYKKLDDSINAASSKKTIEDLRISYETVNKEQKIKLLDKQANLQESQLQKSKLLNNLAIGSLILLLLTIGLLYSRYRLKQRNNLKLEQKEKEISKANLNLRHLLDEKEWLLKEIHHRVKNNLQTVISLLNSQSAYLDNDMALSAIKNSQHRIHSMSLIHQKLYNSENISTINMPNYIKELAEYLKESFSLGQRIRFTLKIAPLELDVAQAVPLGLILNEAITNSIKYAFPGDRNGMIYVTLEGTSENKYLLTIADNGIGFDADISAKKLNSFGMSLIKGLSDDLEANFSMENNNGTILKIEFSQEFPKIDSK